MDFMQFGAAGECLMDVKPRKTRLRCLFEQALRSAGAPRRHPKGGVHFAPERVIGDLKTIRFPAPRCLLRNEMTCRRMDEIHEAWPWC